MRCSSCKEPAVINLPHLGKDFCTQHLISSVEERVLATIKESNMVSEKDVIAVANSGGKDSFTALNILKKHFPNNKIFSIAIDEGIEGYREKTLELMKDFCNRLGVEYHVFSYKGAVGLKLDEIIKKKAAIPCSICGPLRRYLLNKAARELGATKLVTGHNLDDEAQSVLMNIFQNDTNKFLRLGPIAGVAEDKMFIPRIKPLRKISERETMVYALSCGVEPMHEPCTYANFAFRNTVRNKLNELEAKHPGTKLRILENFDKLQAVSKQSSKRLSPSSSYCNTCGEPSSSEMCNICKLKIELVA
jgi:uncharacterized protein (TIGR00269 family)